MTLDPIRAIRAIRQILLEKNCTQVIFEPSSYDNTNDIPQMTHYCGAVVPVYSVTLPYAVPREQRHGDWSENRMNDGIVLACECDGFLYYDLLDPTKHFGVPEQEWDTLLCCTYDELIDPLGDDDWDDWLQEFEQAADNGVPPEARALRARLLRKEFSEDFPCITSSYHTIRLTIITNGCQESVDIEFNSVYPKDDTVAVLDHLDFREVVVRNTADKASRTEEHFNCHSLPGILADNDEIRREMLRRRLSALLDHSDEKHPVAIGVADRDHAFESAFQVPGDGTIWATDRKGQTLDFDDIPTDTLEWIAAELSDRLDWIREVRTLLKHNHATNPQTLEPNTPISPCIPFAPHIQQLQAFLDGQGHIATRPDHSQQTFPENSLSAADLRALQSGILIGRRREKTVDTIKSALRNANGHIDCSFPFQEYIVSVDQPGTAVITALSLNKQDQIVIQCEAYDEQSLDSTDRYRVDFLEELAQHILKTNPAQ